MEHHLQYNRINPLPIFDSCPINTELDGDCRLSFNFLTAAFFRYLKVVSKDICCTVDGQLSIPALFNAW